MSGALLCALLLLICASSKPVSTKWLVPAGTVVAANSAFANGGGLFCALTFDDGPDGRYTTQVREILDARGIDATFFVVGNRIERHIGEVLELLAAGHEIGSHSYNHPDMSKMSAAQMKSELATTDKLFQKYGIPVNWFRPPYGAYNKQLIKSAAEFDLETILWSVDPKDWATPGSAVIHSRVASGIRPGAVVLLHSTNEQTVQALPGIIDDLSAKGYSFVTLSDWRRLITGQEVQHVRQQLDEKLQEIPGTGRELEIPIADWQPPVSAVAPVAKTGPADWSPGFIVISNFRNPGNAGQLWQNLSAGMIYAREYAALEPPTVQRQGLPELPAAPDAVRQLPAPSSPEVDLAAHQVSPEFRFVLEVDLPSMGGYSWEVVSRFAAAAGIDRLLAKDELNPHQSGLSILDPGSIPDGTPRITLGDSPLSGLLEKIFSGTELLVVVIDEAELHRLDRMDGRYTGDYHALAAFNRACGELSRLSPETFGRSLPPCQADWQYTARTGAGFVSVLTTADMWKIPAEVPSGESGMFVAVIREDGALRLVPAMDPIQLETNLPAVLFFDLYYDRDANNDRPQHDPPGRPQS